MMFSPITTRARKRTLLSQRHGVRTVLHATRRDRQDLAISRLYLIHHAVTLPAVVRRARVRLDRARREQAARAGRNSARQQGRVLLPDENDYDTIRMHIGIPGISEHSFSYSNLALQFSCYSASYVFRIVY